MKVGLSSYSLYRLINRGEIDILQAMDWIADNGGEHVEIVPFGFDLVDNDDLIQSIVEKAKEVGIEISNYAISANFIQDSEEEYKEEIERVKDEVDIAHKLGVELMRHDVASHAGGSDLSIKQFNKDLPAIVEACQEIADYASRYNITTSVENHGFYINGSERIQRLIDKVKRTNFKVTLDIGNFMCVDEKPEVGVKRLLPNASIIHLKDFYLRSSFHNPGGGNWFKTNFGDYLRGAIVGQGDINTWQILKIIKRAGYDGYFSIEFEGMEECRIGSRIGMENSLRIWEEV